MSTGSPETPKTTQTDPAQQPQPWSPDNTGGHWTAETSTEVSSTPGLMKLLGLSALAKTVSSQFRDAAGEIKDRSVIGAANFGADISTLRKQDLEQRSKKLETSIVVHKEVVKGRVESNLPPKGVGPVTLSERRQSLRASRRQAKANVTRVRDQKLLKRVYGDDIVKEGYGKTVDTLRSSGRIGPVNAYRQKKAARKHSNNITKIANLSGHSRDGSIQKTADGSEYMKVWGSGKVGKSARGEDLPGVLLNKRLAANKAKLTKEVPKLDARVSHLDTVIIQKRKSIKNRRDERKARAALPPELSNEERWDLFKERWEQRRPERMDYLLGSMAVSGQSEPKSEVETDEHGNPSTDHEDKAVNENHKATTSKKERALRIKTAAGRLGRSALDRAVELKAEAKKRLDNRRRAK